MTTAAPAIPAWKIRGHLVLACNCDYGCPCNFNGLPTTGDCQGNWNWRIDSGAYGDVDMAGVCFGVVAKWPGAIHEGNGEALVLIDAAATEAQRDAVGTLLSGAAGGPWKIIATTLVAVHGPEVVPMEIVVDGMKSRVRAGRALTLDLDPVRNKVTGAESHATVQLPMGFVFKEALLCASSTFRSEGPVALDHGGKYAAVAPFEYAGP